MKSKKTLLQVIGLVVILAGTWGAFPAQVLAACSYSGPVSWTQGADTCRANVTNATAAEGEYRDVSNDLSINPGFAGSVRYRCQSGAFVQEGNFWCRADGGAQPGACSYALNLNWNVNDGGGHSYACGTQMNDASWLNGQSRTVTNTLSGVTGSATYVCSNGIATLSGGMACTPSGGGSTPTPPGGGGGTPTPPGGGSGGGTPPPSGGGNCIMSNNLPCQVAAGQYGIPVNYTNGDAIINYNSCTATFAYLGGCSAGDGSTPGTPPGKPPTPSCTPDNARMATTCNTETFINNCGDFVFGTCKTQACCGTVLTPDTTCSQGACQVKGCKSGYTPTQESCNSGFDSCCIPKTVTPPVLTSAPWSNPLAFNTVEDLLDKILGYLQGIIVILSLIMIVIGSIVYMTAAGNDSKLSTGKLIITASLIGLALALAAPSFLKQIGDIVGWNNTNVQNVQSSKTLLEILQNVLNFLLSIVGILAIIMLVVGGIMYLTAAGDEDRIKTGKSIVQYSLIGIAVSLAALVIVTQVIAFFS